MSPLDVIEAFGKAWASHDLDEALSYLSNDCLFDATGPAPDGARHIGREEIGQAWKSIFSDPSSLFETEEIFEADDRVVQRWRYCWEGGHVRGVDLFRVSDGRITEKLSYVKG